MPKASISRNLKWARNFDVGVLRQLHGVIHGINPEATSITATYSNGLEVEYLTVDELLSAPTTNARKVKRLRFHASEPVAWPPVEGQQPPLQATVILEADLSYMRTSLDIQGDANRCVALERQLDDVFHSALLPFRSLFYVPFSPDWWLVLAGTPILTTLIVAPTYLTEMAAWVAGCALAVVYIAVKLLVFPRLQFNFGRGARAVARQKWILTGLFGFMIAGGFGSIFQEYVKIWYFGPSATEQGTAHPAGPSANSSTNESSQN
ncbi:hypothetical protein E0H56_03980 [Rhizobium leguminosarum bv. viciae]|uniref:hypothetical protein n=1 Tax=Rhizobium leguminosarum TaxID=384 RepID=UPI00103C12E3|nr:hypothetical protein [Rhizobium leguminosarum]TBZ98276.1 hypothetical protein E0H56_03980 [Rhizobium leguminosarum bv. viciae]